jgi:hypothetical protein
VEALNFYEPRYNKVMLMKGKINSIEWMRIPVVLKDF